MSGIAAPLAGVRVVDLGQWMAGPAAARLLADNGADVVHVDPPGGWRWTAEANAVLNHGKRQVTLDFNAPDDLAEAQRLIAECDVVIENFRPGALTRFGLDHESVRAAFPDKVYVSLPGFASTDAEYASVAAFEGVIAAATGQFSDMGVNRVLMGVEASYSPLPLGSAYAGVFGAMAVGLALRARLRSGGGDHIEVPIASSLLEALAYNSMHVEDLPRRYLSRREEVIEDHRARGLPMALSYDELQPLLDPFYRSYWCADGLPLYVVAVSHRRHPRALLEVLGLWEETQAAGLPTHDPYLPTSQWPDGADCTLLAHPISARWSGWLSSRIASALRARTSTDWEELLGAHGIPAIGHRTTAEWLDNGHAGSSGLLVDIESPALGPTQVMGPVVWTAPVVRPEEQQVGPPQPAAPAEASVAGGGWLDGITVVDLTNVIAGPTIATTLARFGARVIKVDPPEPTFDPWNTALCGLHSNRGKESVLLDVRSQLGRPAFERLLARADVVTINASDQQLTRLGLTAAELAALAPGAVLCHLDAWSGARGGPWRHRLGYDDLVQAATGIMARFGGGLDTPEEHAHFGTIDVLTGLAAATATAFALYAKGATGQPHSARASLAAAGQLIQAPYICRHAGPRPPEPSGPAARGESPAYQLYPTQDVWVFVSMSRASLHEVCAAFLPGHDPANPDHAVGAALGDLLLLRTSSEWQKLLGPLGVTVQPLGSLATQRDKHTEPGHRPWGSSSFHFNAAEAHESGRVVTLVAPLAVRPDGARVVVPTDAPKYGAQTQAVLTELGYEPGEITDMVDTGAAGLSWSAEYLPS